MHVAITGATGVIGSALSGRLRSLGHQVSAISRSPGGPETIVWSPQERRLDPEALRGVDAVVHLAAQPITLRPWTRTVKERLRSSRVRGTDLIARTLAGLDDGPRVLVSVSGTHFYGDRGDEVLTESSGPGTGFLAEVSRQWEAATAPAADAGIRTTVVRVGIVQSPASMQLRVQLPLYRMGLGGRLGAGDQWWSWVGIEDVVGILTHALTTDDAPAVMNATAPHPVRQADYATALGRAVGRPTVLAVPRFAPRLVLPGLADELIFYSMRVLPEATLASGYVFRQPTLDEALRTMTEPRGGELRGGAPRGA